jgi:hypothetical protein
MPDTLRAAMRGALRTRLLALSGVPTVLWEGETFEPPTTLHLRETLRTAPGATRVISLGTPVRHSETLAQLLLEVWAPAPRLGTSRNTPASTLASPLLVAETWADTLAQQFAPGLTLTYDGRAFVMERASPGTAQARAAGWFVALVTVDLQHTFTSYT